jgi:DNA-directed RNA polymerase alpha subunit
VGIRLESIPIEQLMVHTTLRARTFNCLKRRRIRTLAQLAGWTRGDVLFIRNAGLVELTDLTSQIGSFVAAHAGGPRDRTSDMQSDVPGERSEAQFRSGK